MASQTDCETLSQAQIDAGVLNVDVGAAPVYGEARTTQVRAQTALETAAGKPGKLTLLNHAVALQTGPDRLIITPHPDSKDGDVVCWTSYS